MIFVCPKCKSKLNIRETDKCAFCQNGHSFDRAAAGYYNLLLGVSGGTHGDNKEMVEARRSFLMSGYYSELCDRVAELVCSYTQRGGVILDAGAGEGYYTDAIEKSIYDRDGESRVLAFDISKDAVKNIAKKNKRIESVVAGSYDMPLFSESVDTVVNIFSPLALEEVRRTLRRGGHFVMVFPNRRHLYALKSAIYDTPYENSPQETELDGFELVHSENVTYTMHLEGKENIRNLFMMTPYAYRTGKAQRDRIEGLTRLDCEADFIVLVYKRL